MKSMLVIIMALFLMSGVIAGVGNFEVKDVVDLPIMLRYFRQHQWSLTWESTLLPSARTIIQ